MEEVKGNKRYDLKIGKERFLKALNSSVTYLISKISFTTFPMHSHTSPKVSLR